MIYKLRYPKALCNSKRVRIFVLKNAEFEESKHKRDEKGQFSSTGNKSQKSIKTYKISKKSKAETPDLLSELNTLQSRYDKLDDISDKDKSKLDAFVKSLKEKYGSGMDKDYNWLYQKNMTPAEKSKHDEYMSIWQKSAGEFGKIASELMQKKQEYKDYQKKQEVNKKEKEFNEKIKSGQLHPFNKTIRNIIKKGKYDNYGIRVVSDNPNTGKEDKYVIGDIAKPSYEWEDGQSKSNRRLLGTSAIEINQNDEDFLSKVSRYWGNGNQVVLLGSNNYEGGNDPGETVMKNPKVLATLDISNIERPKIENSIHKKIYRIYHAEK